MLNIQFANRFETLSELLIEKTGRATDSAFSAIHVVVPTAAVQRRLTLDMARRHGICANVRFSYLAQWLWQQLGRLVPASSSQSPNDASALAWRIYCVFADKDWVQPYKRLAEYLGRADAVMQYELAQKVASTFDQYITYRPDWLDVWAENKIVGLGTDPGVNDDQVWQAALWRRLCNEIGSDGRHPAAAFVTALERQLDKATLAETLPRTIHVFGLPTLPPMHLTLLQMLSRHIDVELYAMNPCREYWFEVVNQKRLAYLAALGKSEHQEVGHRLLAAWGQQAQSTLIMQVEAGGESVIDDAHFDENPKESLLAQLQNSILDLADLKASSIELMNGDRSIEVHVCHSLSREIEVLQDRLLALFAGAEAPAPEDIVVVTPDIDAAAPLIDAIFGTAPKDRYIPYTITGRPRSDVNPLARAFLDLLALANSRFTVTSVFGLLQQPSVARCFGLNTDDLDQARTWLQDAGVHWALDAEHRGSWGVPPMKRHSFSDGMDRLFLGYALPARSDTPFDGRLPAGDVEGSEALNLGALSRFIDALAAIRMRMAKPLTADAWALTLANALDAFIAPDSTEIEDLQEVHAALEQLSEQFRISAMNQSLPLDVVRTALTEALDDPIRGGVPTGMVTITSMSSLRNIPFKAVCVIGLNDGAFPTSTRAAEFDLLPHQPRLGDRQRRIDERNVFLDLLLAAREVLHLSYVGRSVRDNSLMPPSVLVSELLEYLLPAISKNTADSKTQAIARGKLVVEHPLQPFSEIAFKLDGDIRLRSFNREYAEALKKNLSRDDTAKSPEGDVFAGSADLDDTFADEDAAAGVPSIPFFASPLPAPGAEWHDVPIERLTRFFRNPCRYLLERRLKIGLRRDEDELENDEPFLPSIPGRAALARRLLPYLLEGRDVATVRALALASTDVPMGAMGKQFLDRELAGLQSFANKVRELIKEPCLPQHSVSKDIEAEGVTLRIHTGFADIRSGGLVGYQYDDLRPNYFIGAWLRHLMLCISTPAGVTAVTTWQGRDGRFLYKPVDVKQAVSAMQTLLSLYVRGLQSPLYFFPKSSWTYVEKDDSLAAAANVWRVSTYKPFAEGADAGYRLALRGLPDPMAEGSDDFSDCSHAVLDPLFASLEME